MRHTTDHVATLQRLDGLAPRRMSDYEAVYQRSIEDPAAYWLEAAGAIDWITAPARALHERGWFADGVLNTAHNALDRHVEVGRGGALALIYDSPVTSSIRRWTYREARDEVALIAGALRRLGVGRGDRVLLSMPMVPEAVFAMLGCARIGAVHSVVFGGFAARELAIRIDDARPVAVISASCGIEGSRVIPYQPLLDDALAQATHVPAHGVVLQRPQYSATLREDALPWEEFLRGAEPAACVPLASADPLYVLYTSGTTGKPKGVVRDNGGHAVALQWSMEHVYDARASDVFWAASDIGWVVGHSYMVYAPLLIGATTVLYEGKPVGTPDAGRRRVLARRRGTSRRGAVHRADGDAGDPQGRSRRPARARARLLESARALSRRRADGPRYPRLVVGAARLARRRPLVADRDGLADRFDMPRPRPRAGARRLSRQACARLRDRGARRRRGAVGPAGAGRDRPAAAASARLPARALGG